MSKKKGLKPKSSASFCELCGEKATPDRPLETMILSPPVDGYRLEIMKVHRDCGDKYTKQMEE